MTKFQMTREEIEAKAATSEGRYHLKMALLAFFSESRARCTTNWLPTNGELLREALHWAS